jgi:hypothetical protein
VIGPVGARRALALLVIGDAVLGGAFVGVLLRPTGESTHPPRPATTTTVVQPAPTVQAGAVEFAPDASPRAPASTLPAPATTVAPTTVPPAPSTTVPSTQPHVAEVTTTAPATTPPTMPSTTLAPPTTVPPIEAAD